MLNMSLRGGRFPRGSNLLAELRLLPRTPALAGGAREEQERSSQRHHVTNLYPTPVTVSIFTEPPSSFLRRCAMCTSTVRVCP